MVKQVEPTSYPGFREMIAALGPAAAVNASLAIYAGVGVGGPADALIIAQTRDEMIRAIGIADSFSIPWRVYGSLTNVLLPDSGLRGLVILNHLRAYEFTDNNGLVSESGVIMVKVAREAIRMGRGGLVWAVGLPGTIGGAVVNNAGAFGGEISRILTSAEVFNPGSGIQHVDSSWFDFEYRYSKLKAKSTTAIVLDAHFQLKSRDRQAMEAKAEEYTARRRRTQPAGKTLGSTFKNPEGDYAGRLIEAAGLKGMRKGGFVISHQHANFFINEGNGLAADYRALIKLAQDAVMTQYGIALEPEIEILPEEERLLTLS
ncbi:MAG: UDP-N-acetylmuramate dehydrogenase [Anaerolineae bacterium]|nr:UDP-N-acetylmuramate dehydrogenase [Anaerolineae bacterium]